MRPVVLGLVLPLVVLPAAEGRSQGRPGRRGTQADLVRLEALTIREAGQRPRFDLEGPYLVDRGGRGRRRIPLDRARAQVHPRGRVLALVCTEGARCAREGRRAVNRLEYRIRGGRAELDEALDLVHELQDRIDRPQRPRRGSPGRRGVPPARAAWRQRNDDPLGGARSPRPAPRVDGRDPTVRRLNRIFARSPGSGLSLHVDAPDLLLVRRDRTRHRMPLDLVVGGIDRKRGLLCIRCRAGARCVETSRHRGRPDRTREVCAKVDLGRRALERARDDVDRLADLGRRGGDHALRRR